MYLKLYNQAMLCILIISYDARIKEAAKSIILLHSTLQGIWNTFRFTIYIRLSFREGDGGRNHETSQKAQFSTTPNGSAGSVNTKGPPGSFGDVITPSGLYLPPCCFPEGATNRARSLIAARIYV